MWQTRNCFITACGPFHWVSAKAVGIMDTVLCEVWCRNNGLFVQLPISAVHVFHNQASTITVQLCARSSCFAVNCDAFCFDVWVGAQVLAEWLVFLNFLVWAPSQASCEEQYVNFETSQGYKYDENSVYCNLTLSTLLQATCLTTVPQFLLNHLILFHNYRLSNSCPTSNISALLLFAFIRELRPNLSPMLSGCFHTLACIVVKVLWYRDVWQITRKINMKCLSNVLAHSRAKHFPKNKKLAYC